MTLSLCKSFKKWLLTPRSILKSDSAQYDTAQDDTARSLTQRSMILRKDSEKFETKTKITHWPGPVRMMKNTRGRKSRWTVPLRVPKLF